MMKSFEFRLCGSKNFTITKPFEFDEKEAKSVCVIQNEAIEKLKEMFGAANVDKYCWNMQINMERPSSTEFPLRYQSFIHCDEFFKENELPAKSPDHGIPNSKVSSTDVGTSNEVLLSLMKKLENKMDTQKKSFDEKNVIFQKELNRQKSVHSKIQCEQKIVIKKLQNDVEELRNDLDNQKTIHQQQKVVNGNLRRRCDELQRLFATPMRLMHLRVLLVEMRERIRSALGRGPVDNKWFCFISENTKELVEVHHFPEHIVNCVKDKANILNSVAHTGTKADIRDAVNSLKESVRKPWEDMFSFVYQETCEIGK